MKLKRRILAILLVLLMCFTLVPTGVFAGITGDTEIKIPGGEGGDHTGDQSGAEYNSATGNADINTGANQGDRQTVATEKWRLP